ncbi:zinc finger TRAF-type-containing protein 1 isoform X2 [Mustela lutreola]|uniref:zinc finger TRAF-type-containing protein 1 isoform X2 n=1 Tax=Mustela lutreola TaxID=9666 RepID=UPI002796E4B0|nr:zinc finger TRAF-type-containing protein 1 isoform X2 [Mustela lutreola]
MSGAEEAGGGGPAAGPAGAVPAGAGAGVGVGAGPGAAAGPAAAAALGEAAGPGLPDEAGLAGARQLQEAAGDPDAPPKKRLRAAEAAEAAAAAAAAGSGKLEERLYSVLCCTVCLDLPKASVYQEPYWPCVGRVPGRGPVPPEQWPWLPLRTCRPFCSGSPRGGLVRACARPADARLKEEQATCPNCRCEISKSLCCRNLAVEKAVSELPSECGFCLRQFPRSLLERHQKEECQDRVTQCKYKRIGCPWHGPFHELTVHEAACAHPTKTGNELMEILDEMDQSHRKEMQLYNSIFSLLSFEKIGYTGLHSPWDGQCLSRRWVYLGGPGSQGPALWSQRREEHSAHPVLQADTAVAAGLLRPSRRCPGAGLLRELRVLRSKCRVGSGRPGTGRLDRTQARWISRALLATATAFGHAGEQEPGQGLVQTQEQQEAPADTGAAEGDCGPLLLSPQQAVGSASRAATGNRSRHAILPGLGLARCGPAQA